MIDCEFYIYEDELWYITSEGKNAQLTEKDVDIVRELAEVIHEHYPAAYKALAKEYERSLSNIAYFRFLLVRRFCRCNFGELDTTRRDIRFNNLFQFEKVKCPLRRECKFEGVVCSPKFNSKLSETEIRVMKLLYQGYTREEVAEMLYLSPLTIKRHQMSSYAKVGVHSLSDFMRYANQNNLFNTQE